MRRRDAALLDRLAVEGRLPAMQAHVSESPVCWDPFGMTEARLSRHLLSLHRALTLDELWRSLRTIFRSLLPNHSLSLYLNYFAIDSDFQAYHAQNAPGSVQPWEERRRFSPTPAYLRSHVGRKIFGLSDLIPDDRAVVTSDYFRHVMSVEGWRSMLCLTYWWDNLPRVMVVLRRTGDQGEVTPGERALVKVLYDHIEIALLRIRAMHDEQTGKACTERCLPHYPLGLLVLDSNRRVVLRNRETLETCRLWNYGPVEAPRYDLTKSFAVPAALTEACDELNARWAGSDHGSSDPADQSILLPNPHIPTARARVSLIRPRECCLARPWYLVQLFDSGRATSGAAGLSPAGLLRLQVLTPREQEVALAVSTGLSNLEIALHLGKSEATVKSQMVSIFQKLDLTRRSQLVSALR